MSTVNFALFGELMAKALEASMAQVSPQSVGVTSDSIGSVGEASGSVAEGSEENSGEVRGVGVRANGGGTVDSRGQVEVDFAAASSHERCLRPEVGTTSSSLVEDDADVVGFAGSGGGRGDVGFARGVRVFGRNRAGIVRSGVEKGLTDEERHFYSNYVHVRRVNAVREILQKVIGRKIPDSAMPTLALATYSAAAVPDVFADGRDALKMLAMLGDAAMLTSTLEDCLRSGAAVSSMQAAKVALLSDASLGAAFTRSPLCKEFNAGGVSLSVSKTAATAAEAYAGVLYLYVDSKGVSSYCNYLRGLMPARV